MVSATTIPSFSDRAQRAEEAEAFEQWKGLAGHWCPMWIQGDRLLDLSGNIHHGSFERMDTSTVWVSSELGGYAVELDGANDYIDLGSSPRLEFADSGFSVSVWTKRTGPGTRQYNQNMIIGKAEQGVGGYLMMYSDAGWWRAYVASGGTSWGCFSQTAAADLNKWTHLVMTYDRSLLRFYRNGQLADVPTEAGYAPTTRSAKIGGGWTASTPVDAYEGSIADARIYDYPISGALVREIYYDFRAVLRRQRSGLPPRLVPVPPFQVARGQAFSTGQEAGDVFVAGRQAGSLFGSGQEAGQVHG